MSVEEALGITDEVAIQIVKRRWSDWATDHPVLRKAKVDDLRNWLRCSDARTVGDVMHALACLGATDGGDDLDAAKLVAWLLVPVAGRVASELVSVLPDVDHLVASQLWIEVRTLNWRA